jgi:hypothetical protein
MKETKCVSTYSKFTQRTNRGNTTLYSTDRAEESKSTRSIRRKKMKEEVHHVSPSTLSLLNLHLPTEERNTIQQSTRDRQPTHERSKSKDLRKSMRGEGEGSAQPTGGRTEKSQEEEGRAAEEKRNKNKHQEEGEEYREEQGREEQQRGQEQRIYERGMQGGMTRTHNCKR